MLTTPLHQWHLGKGAKMVEFAGYEMPVQYQNGVLKEHLHTRSAAGLFDVSHMGQVLVTGDKIADALETVFPANIKALPIGKQCYSLLLNEEGGVLDDLMICRREHDFMLVVNAACKDKDYAYLKSLLGSHLDLVLLDDRALLALQGPRAVNVMESFGLVLKEMAFMDAGWLDIVGIECWVTRSGYTGEDGFELSVSADKAVALANLLADHPDVEPIGLGARDSLRLEAGLCLYGHELDPHTTPIEANLKWAIAPVRRKGGGREGGFIGATHILEQIENGVDRLRVGLLAEGRAPIRDGAELYDENDKLVGKVTSGGFGPSIEKPVAMAIVDSEFAKTGNTLYAAVRKKKLPATIVQLPFVPNRFYRP